MIRIPTWVAVVFVVAVPSVMWAADVVLPHIFVAGTTIRAAEVNENFGPLWAEHSAGARFVITGSTQQKDDIYATPLDHPLLNGNSGAFVFVSTGDYQSLWACVSTQGNNAIYLYQFPSYEGGRWWVRATCPGVRYRVLAFGGAR